MIPPSIVLIIYGLITETSIKALFTGAFVPGFMLATFIILYIVIRTVQQDAPLPNHEGDQRVFKMGHVRRFRKPFVGWRSALLLLRAVYFTVMGMNVVRKALTQLPLVNPKTLCH